MGGRLPPIPLLYQGLTDNSESTTEAKMTVPKRQARWRMPHLNLRRREAIEGYLFIFPWVIGFLIFTAGPMLASLVLSFTKWGLVDTPEFRGLDNYIGMAKDPLFWHSLSVTVRYTIFSASIRLILALAVALLMIRPLRGINLMRTIYYVPAVLGGVPVALLWMWVFRPDYGILNYILKIVGIEGPEWLADPNWALWAIVIISLWNIGLPMVIFIAGLQAIPSHLSEAATVDGANWWHKLRYVTLPMLSPTILFLLVSQIIQSFQVFDVVYVLTEGQGGPVRSTLVYLLYFYRNGFSYFRMGYASALAWVLLVIILILTALIFKSSGLWVFYEAEVRK